MADYVHVATNVAPQPVFRLVDLFEESTEYERLWRLPFHSLALCVRDDPGDPSWVELLETGERWTFKPGQVHFTAALTPMRLRYTTKNRHLCIHFRHELFPGVDVFSNLHGRVLLERGGGPLAEKMKAIFADPDPLRRLVRAEAVALEASLPFWPERPPIELVRVAPYAEVLRDVRDTLSARTTVRDLASRMGLPETRFPRVFRSLIGMAPKQWLEQALFDRSLRLLSDPRRSVKDVAYELEFSDEFNFSRFIKRRCGLPPKLLRSRFGKA
ncbi:MAG: helix-turn-helix transcriptional regulator [Kiritimatiellae bacterium]|nr:helix-turn-helix transcriptional regulator [Kiritimatiellia bacterium]